MDIYWSEKIKELALKLKKDEEQFLKMYPNSKIEMIEHPSIVERGNGYYIEQKFYVHPDDTYRWIFKWGVNDQSIDTAIRYAKQKIDEFIDNRTKVLIR